MDPIELFGEEYAHYMTHPKGDVDIEHNGIEVSKIDDGIKKSKHWNTSDTYFWTLAKDGKVYTRRLDESVSERYISVIFAPLFFTLDK